MENATKALLIAAAVLVAIFIISLSMSLVNSNAETTNQADSALQSNSTYAFNEQFLYYFGNSVTGNKAKALTNKILYHNAAVNSTTFSAGEHHVYLNFYPKGESKITHKWKTSDLQKIYNKILNGARYKISVTNCGTYPGGYYFGYVICISIKEL